MISIGRLLTGVLLAVAAAMGTGCRPGAEVQASGPLRYIDESLFISTALPEIRIEVSPGFSYLGNEEFDLKDVARVDRHIFVDAPERRVQRMIVLQFEGFLDDVDHTYRDRSTNPVTLGGRQFNQNTFFFDNAESIARNPGAETDHTTSFLARRGYRLDDELMTSRVVRVVDSERRHELIIFYVENVRDTGYTLAEISEQGAIREPYTDIAEDLTRRSLAAFRVLAGPGQGGSDGAP